MSETVWLAIIGTVVMCLKEYFDQRRTDRIAAKAEVVRATLVEATRDQNKKLDSQTEKLDAVAGDISAVKTEIHTVELATNSMKDALVKATGEAAFAAGAAAADEKAKGITDGPSRERPGSGAPGTDR